MYNGRMRVMDRIYQLVVPTPEPVICLVGDMSDPVNASGRCYETAHTVVQSGYLSGGEIVILCPQNRNTNEWWHAAVLIPNELTGSGTVYDFTARQFNPDLPFPYITDLDTWADCIEEHAQVGKIIILD